MGKLFKSIGIISGIFGGLLMLMGVIGFFVGDFLFVKYYRYWFLFAMPFVIFGIFGLLVYLAEEKKE